jgi:alkaline phosphatase D
VTCVVVLTRSRRFRNPPLDNLLAIGAVTPRSVRIWVRVARPGRYRLCWRSAENQPVGETLLDITDPRRDLTASVEISEGLCSNARYRIALCDALRDQPLAHGSFHTAPGKRSEIPLRFSIALLSCHQPFSDSGRVRRNTEPMLKAMLEAFRQHEVRQVILAGDQLYSDFPKKLSLFNDQHFSQIAPEGRGNVLECTEAEVRELFHRRYRHFWNIAGWRHMLANYACCPILDDHDIVDNWGSALEHGTAAWQPFRNGAINAYVDYQGSLVRATVAEPSDHLDYQLELGDTATYVMDLRSNRRVGEAPRIFSSEQFDKFRRFLQTQRDKSVLFVVMSVPVIHLPHKLTRLMAPMTPGGEDFSDRWSTRGHGQDRDRVLGLLHEHQRNCPSQRIVLLSGDIHIGCLHRIRWYDAQPNLYQFISSGVTHDAGKYLQLVSSLIIRANRRFVTDDGPQADLDLLRGEREAHANPCGGLNVGIVEMTRAAVDDPPTLRFLLYSHRGDRPLCRYRSPPITGQEVGIKALASHCAAS